MKMEAEHPSKMSVNIY